ncbi:hypothetical protein BP6252_11555 [Coleophoma cylindrospora]|uniref:Prolyl 4-hydroxylase alpha subunit domain-containing protein n=1 Tax=Coleophoma cylindrospora TaxID=1849047 RepID=A0A3D8QJZ0_9HELO|nr:hypothetical protein BP6252_11555 [Coleophoma cylindrospora]
MALNKGQPSKFSLLFIWLCLSGLVSAWYNLLPTSLQNPYELFSGQAAKNPYEIYLLSEDPYVVYIEGFVTPQEASHLVSLSEPHFKPSPLWSDDGKVKVDPTYRSSVTATLSRDKVIEDIEERARTFPGYDSSGLIKPLVVQKYQLGNQYKDHYDWFHNGPTIGGNIESTFFVYIEANCTGGGTNFPRLNPPPTDEKWCKFIDCDRPYEDGVTFKPITGNAVFWKNLKNDGEGNTKTLHSGQPVTSGTKLGLNIWTWTPV